MFIKNVARKAHRDPKGLLFRKTSGSRKGYSYHKGRYTCVEAAVQHAMAYRGFVMLHLSFWGIERQTSNSPGTPTKMSFGSSYPQK